jgi:hypothetical protein
LTLFFREIYQCYTPAKFKPLQDGNKPRFSSECRSHREANMEISRTLILTMLMISWSVITAALSILVIYRVTLSSKEDDQIFIDDAEQHYYKEQQAIISRMSRLTRPIITLAVMSGVLLLASAGVWMYQGYSSF